MHVEGIGPPLVTPFDERGDVDYDRLRKLVEWVEVRGVDFLVPCGSTSEAELLTSEERSRVIETVVDAASVPVVAGTGHPGLRETRESTRAAADGGADAALVVTPFYYNHDQETLAAYYRELADSSPLPVYLYSVPVYTNTHLEPETVGRLSSHPSIVGIKDSSGSLGRLIRTERRVSDPFTLLVGSADIATSGMETGASGAILAVANLHPELTAELIERRADRTHTRELNATLCERQTAVLEYGIAGLKWAMREQGAPAGYPRSPHRQLDTEAQTALVAELDNL